MLLRKRIDMLERKKPWCPTALRPPDVKPPSVVTGEFELEAICVACRYLEVTLGDDVLVGKQAPNRGNARIGMIGEVPH